jgi:hypothetical protein
MRELTCVEIQFISGANYEDWQVVTIAGVSSGLAFGTIEAIHGWSLLAGLKFFAICSIPTAIASGAIVGGATLYDWMNA